MAKAVLPTNFQDDILSENMNNKRRYNVIQNSDGTISLEDATDYTQVGSNFGAAQINQTNNAINESADKNKIIDDIEDIVANTQPGMIAGALAVRELNSKCTIVENIPLSLNTNGYTNTTWAQKRGNEVKVYPQVIGVPVKNSTIATGFPSPKENIFVENTEFGIVQLDTSGKLLVNSPGATTSEYFFVPFSYFTD